MVINTQRAQGDLLLKHIKLGFVEDYIISLKHSFLNIIWRKGTFLSTYGINSKTFMWIYIDHFYT
jgi:hypothetical protein